jgi:prephenate dehydrogenase
MENSAISKNTEILIVGLGLLGGSYAKKLTDAGYKVSGIVRREYTANYALTRGFVQAVAIAETKEAIELVKNADITVLCIYPSDVVDWVKMHKNHFKQGAIITDVTGVKSKIVPEIENELAGQDAEFIGVHPMAGKETGGIENANPHIFSTANYIITPTANTSERALLFAHELGRIFGFARISELDINTHDKMIAFLSQLTHVIAVSLMNADYDERMKCYTGDSFRDLTRIAKIDENMWSSLFMLNKDNLLHAINDFENSLDELKNAIATNDIDTLKELFIRSTARRTEFDG